MESAIFGLIGVALGAALTIAKEWWFHHLKSKKEAAYLAALVSCELDRFVGRCAAVVGDDGLCYGSYNSEGVRERQVTPPTFAPLSMDVEWKSLPPNLMFEILDLPRKAEIADGFISSEFEHSAFSPDYEQGFEERQHQYATLGITAAKLVSELRKHAGFPDRPVDDWDPVQYMEEKKTAIEHQRATRSPPPPPQTQSSS